ncbi:MAG: prolyl oligopeptidase family serine peptidase, partial [Rubripirellula sp.]
YKKLPPDGIAIDPKVRKDLEDRVRDLQTSIERAAQDSADSESWTTEVEVFVRAVRMALEQNLFFKKSEPEHATKLLDEAARRLTAAKSGERGLRLLGLAEVASDQPQLLVGGFRSSIDDSVQPYGLVIPARYVNDDKPRRVDVWLHGRGDSKTEVPFLHERMNKVGLYSPADTIVLHPFGRHCNAFKFAGETDVYESLTHLETLVEIDQQRVAIRGFSMGGAGCWHFAVHDPCRWFAVNPGAGFVDTIVYQGWQDQTPYTIDPTRQQLLNWYDVLPWVSNLRNTNTVAYSGQVDKQRQAADRVVAVAEESGIKFPYVIGENMGHKVNPESATQIESVIDQWAEASPLLPREEIDFVTYTLRYNQAAWLRVTGLKEHWKPSRIQGRVVDANTLEITTKDITRFEIDFRDSQWPHKPYQVKVNVDGELLRIDDWDEAAGIQCEFEKRGSWQVVEHIDAAIRKRPGLQGPIDDAFCSRFLFVTPSRPAKHGVVQRWIDREFEFAKQRWSRLMRGDVKVVRDTEITEEQIKNCHLICFGDFSSNQYLRRVASHFPMQWTREKLTVGSSEFNPSTHALAFCFPNPRNPERYVVVNSGMTYREFSNVSNSRQIPMLADWSVLDVRQPSNGIFAGKPVADGFFDENWSLDQSTPARRTQTGVQTVP